MNFILFWIPRIGNYIMVMGIFYQLVPQTLVIGMQLLSIWVKKLFYYPGTGYGLLDVVFRQIEIVLKDSTAFFILMNCLDVCVQCQPTYFANDCAVVDEGFLHVSIFDNVQVKEAAIQKAITARWLLPDINFQRGQDTLITVHLIFIPDGVASFYYF